MNDSNAFFFMIGTQPLASWLDLDVGSGGLAGSASYVGGTFTVKGSRAGITGTADGMNFLFKPLTGDGSIVARIVSVQGASAQAGVMIRETLMANSTDMYACFNGYMNLFYRTSTWGSTTGPGNTAFPGMPYWVKLVPIGNVFSAYMSGPSITSRLVRPPRRHQ
jgi:hypothetical protein